MNLKLSIAGAAAAFVLATTGVQAQVFDQYSGAETYHRFCASCHGVAGHGDGPVAPAIPIKVPDLTKLRRKYKGEFPAKVLQRIIDGREAVIYHGTRYMPVWGYEFWVEEGADQAAEERVKTAVENLVDYLRSIQQP